MSGNKLNFEKIQGNVPLVPDNHAAEPSTSRRKFFFRRRPLIIAFFVFNVAIWSLLIAITFR
jgi:hypothetical protein